MSPRTVLVCAIAVVLMCRAGLSSAQSQLSDADVPRFLPPSSRPLVGDGTLSTNVRNATRVFAVLGEREGLNHIRGLLTTSAVEEQWAYLPDQQVWVEIGTSEAGPQVETDAEYLKQLLAFSERVHLYHFHPASYLEPGVNAALALALPSPTDVVSSFKIAKLQQALNPHSDVRNYVVSPYGVVEYGPTLVGRARIYAEATHPRAFIERDLLTLIAIRRTDRNVARTRELAPVAGPLEIISELCSQLSNEHYRMHFAPMGQ